ncbi:hypothetical protein ACFQPG_04990 [Sphingomonas sp. GCM10030256]|uniref:hypothetical protein n=1 Tax=Sphingomonas sp. GCM10030256 TaxID=3273427 RepID=UPI0036091CA0
MPAALLLAAPAALAADRPLFVPVFEENFPDPFIVEHQGEFIAYATRDGPNLPMATSRDLVSWAWVRDAKRTSATDFRCSAAGPSRVSPYKKDPGRQRPPAKIRCISL